MSEKITKYGKFSNKIIKDENGLTTAIYTFLGLPLYKKTSTETEKKYYLLGIPYSKVITVPSKEAIKYYSYFFGIRVSKKVKDIEKFLPPSVIAHYENDVDFSSLKSDIKPIAYYLPQFHDIAENNEWWGKGWTEWTKTKTAKPIFHGHYQPRVPHKDLGYYDLTDVNVMGQQAAMAKKHGIFGFCMYYYWFSGKRLLERPLDNLMKHPEIDFPFLLCWANESWYRKTKWNTYDTTIKILMEQKYSEGWATEFIKDTLPYMADKRYIRNNGKPILLVYKPYLIPDTEKAFEIWRDYCRKNNLGEIEIWLVRTAHDDRSGIGPVSHTYNIAGADREVEFPPHRVEAADKVTHNKGLDVLIDYKTIVLSVLSGKKYPKKHIVRAAMMAWDNTARKNSFNSSSSAFVYHGFSLYLYYRWLRYLISYTRSKFAAASRFVFINAWNEWGEGSYLEPDEKYGYAALNTTSRAVFDLPFEPALPKDAVVINLVERLGDIVAAEPIIRYLKKQYPARPIYWAAMVDYEEVFRYNPHLAGFIPIYDKEQYDAWLKTIPSSALVYNLHFGSKHTDKLGIITNAKAPKNTTEENYWDNGESLLEIFCKIAGLPALKDAPVFYTAPEAAAPAVEGKYIVIQTASKKPTHQYPRWKEVIPALIQKGYKVVELGGEAPLYKEEEKPEGYVDMTGFRYIQDIANIIKGAACFIGIDSGFAHIANALNVPGVILLGKYRTWDSYMPYSGNYANNVKSRILLHKGEPLSAITAQEVTAAVEEVLK